MFKNKDIVLFDGVCNLCISSVRFIINHDKKARFIFASQQSDAGKALMLQFGVKKNETDSILLISKDKLYKRSSAVLQILYNLDGLYPLLFSFYIIPGFIRDPIYTFIANRRYKWFGKKEQCIVGNDIFGDRFI